MKLKKFFNMIFLLLLGLQFNLTSCNSDDNSGNLTAPINDPTNNYQVVVEIVSFGGVMGCTAAVVALSDKGVNDAQIDINGVTLVNDTTYLISNLYSDTLLELSYLTNTSYNLSVHHGTEKIASGTAVMPSSPEITNLNDQHKHQLNKDLEVKWKKVKNASSVEVTLSASFYDSTTQQYIDKEFDSGLLAPSMESIIIPDTMFSVPGEYLLGVIAYNGLNPGSELEDIQDFEGYDKGYNLEGAAGVFLTANVYPNPEGLRILVEQPANLPKSTQSAVIRKSLKQLLVDKQNRVLNYKRAIKISQ